MWWKTKGPSGVHGFFFFSCSSPTLATRKWRSGSIYRVSGGTVQAGNEFIGREMAYSCLRAAAQYFEAYCGLPCSSFVPSWGSLASFVLAFCPPFPEPHRDPGLRTLQMIGRKTAFLPCPQGCRDLRTSGPAFQAFTVRPYLQATKRREQMKGQSPSPVDSWLVLSAALPLPGNGNGEVKRRRPWR